MSGTIEAIIKHTGATSEKKSASATSQTMKAIRIHNYGGPEVLQYEDAPRPQPQAGEVLVRVHAAGVNPIDWKVREGHMKDFWPHKFPLILGWDLSGVVEELGTGPAAAGRFKSATRFTACLIRHATARTLIISSFANQNSRSNRTRFITSARRQCLWLG